jgi:putative Mg2+ transporter-C (MgtC) family protein
LAVLSIHAVTVSDASRVIQGVVTGVGFLGAGVIVRSEKRHHVQGLTTAACVWVTACMGAACAIAQWQIVVIGVVLILVILVFGGRFEKVVDRRWSARRTEVADLPPDTPA